MPRTPPTAFPKSPRHVRLFASAAAIALVAGAVQLLPSAGADVVVIRQVASSEDSGVVDLNRDGVADYARYGVTSSALSVGEQPRDGSDLRLVLPFTVSAAALDAVRGGGYANVSMRVWRVSNLTTQKVVIDAYTGGTSLTPADYNRPATRLATLAPVEGRVAVDVTRQLRSMSIAGILTLRLQLDQLAPRTGGPLTQVNIATSESRDPANRPVLSVSSSATQPTPPTIPTTIPHDPADDPAHHAAHHAAHQSAARAQRGRPAPGARHGRRNVERDLQRRLHGHERQHRALERAGQQQLRLGQSRG